MSQDIGLFLEADRTNAVNSLTVATSRDRDDPAIDLNPTEPHVSIGSDASPSGGALRLEQREVAGSRLFVQDGAGRLELRAGEQRAIDLRASPDTSSKAPVRVFARGARGVEFTHSADGGRITVFDGNFDSPLVVGEAMPQPTSWDITGGRLTVNNSQSDSTCTLLGRDGALLLTGFYDLEDPSRETDPYETAGSDLVIRSRTESRPDGSDSGHDVHVHIQGAHDDDYGAATGNPPRIHADGPNATLTLGRGRIDGNREGVAGVLEVFDERGLQVLGLGTSNGGGEVVVRQGGPNGAETSQLARIVAESDGLAIYDDADQKVFVVTNRGVVKTAGTIDSRGF